MSTAELATHDTSQAGDQALGTAAGRTRFRSALIGVWLGTTFEYLDFALYGLASGLVFGKVFFPEQTPLIALLSAFGTYAVGFLARPLGAVFFGRVGDKYGRKVVLVATIALMGVATTGIGLIPAYHSIGVWAPILLIMLRLMQGFGAGAELSGGAIMLAEFAPVKRRGLVSSLIGLGSNSGTLIASALWLVVLTLPQEDLLAWGWRIPFLGSIVIVICALFLRRGMDESPVYKEFQERKKQQVAAAGQEAHPAESEAAGRSGWRAFFVMMGLRIGENGPSYIAQSFLVGYAVTALSLARSVPTTAVLIASGLGFIIIPLAGWLSDRYGRRVVYIAFCTLLVIYPYPAFMVMDSRDPVMVGAVIVVGMCIASLGIFGVQAAYGVELFGVEHRYTKMAVAKELGSILSGGTAPLVAAALLAATGNWVLLAGYFALMAVIGLGTAVFFAPETKGRDLGALEDAV